MKKNEISSQLESLKKIVADYFASQKFAKNLNSTNKFQNDLKKQIHEVEIEYNRFDSILDNFPASLFVFEKGLSKPAFINLQARKIFSNVLKKDLNAGNFIDKSGILNSKSNKKYPIKEFPLSIAFQGKINYKDDIIIHFNRNKISHFLVTGIPLKNRNGKILTAMLLLQDISEIKSAKSKLSYEQNLIKILLDAIPDLVYIKDVKSRFLLTNKAHAQHLGLSSPNDFIGKTDADFYDKSYAKKFLIDERKILRTKKPFRGIEEPVTDSKGTIKWLSTYKIPFFNEKGKAAGIVGIGRNITEIKKAELKYFEERFLLRTLIDLMPDYIYIKDRDSHFLLANKAEAFLLGAKSVEELIGKSDGDYFPKRLSKKYRADEIKILNSGKSLIGIEEPTVDSAGNAKWSTTTKVPIRNDQGKIIGIAGIGRDITDRKKAEEELIETKNQLEEANLTLEKKVLERTAEISTSKERYRITIEKTGQVIYDYSLNSNTVSWRGAIKKVTGYTNEEFEKISANDFIKLIHPGDRETYITKRDEALNDLKSFYLEYRFKKKNGSFIYIQDNGVYISDHNEGLKMMGAIADISNRKFAEVLLKTQERSSRILKDITVKANEAKTAEEVLKSTMALISSYTYWPIGHVIFYNNKYLLDKPKSLWYSSTPEKYSNLMKTYEKVDNLMMSPIHVKAMVDKKTQWIKNFKYKTDYPLCNEALKFGLESLIVFPVFISGEAVALIEFFSEQKVISDENMPYLLEQIGIQIGNTLERKITQEELIKLSSAVEQSHASIVITNTDGIIEYTNKKFTEVSGYPMEEILGKYPSIVKSGVHDKVFYKELWDTIKSGKIWQGEICNRKKSGLYYWEHVNISPIKNLNGAITHFVAVKDDVTYRKQAEEELKLAKDTAELASRSKSEFLANMSHEIRTPMNSILGFAELLNTKISDEQQRSYLDSIKGSGKSLLTLINDVLDLSKIEAGRMILHTELVDPFLLFKDIEYLFSLKAKEKGLDFSTELDGSLPIGFEVDEVRLRQIMINLLGNAIKFTDKGFVKAQVQCINKHALNNENYVDLKIEVKDSGIGINKEFQDVMFKPFTQQDGQSTKKYGGTGLGLTITKRLVELLNGSISLESEPGKGSCFTVLLKDIKTSHQKIDTTEIITIDPRKITFKPATILIADDVENNRKFLSSVLQDTGLTIIVSRDGLETYELAQVKKPDLIITDLKMPVLNGFDLLKKFRKNPQLKNIPVIATTASASIEERDRLKVHNFDGILIKPIQINDVFLELIRFLPHTISEEEPLADMPKNNNLKINSNKILNAVKPYLEKEYYNMWKTFENQQPLSEVEEFAYKIKDLGKKFNIEELVRFGNRLLTSINNFDIDTMLKILKEYPALAHSILNVNE